MAAPENIKEVLENTLNLLFLINQKLDKLLDLYDDFEGEEGNGEQEPVFKNGDKIICRESQLPSKFVESYSYQSFLSSYCPVDNTIQVSANNISELISSINKSEKIPIVGDDDEWKTKQI